MQADSHMARAYVDSKGASLPYTTDSDVLFLMPLGAFIIFQVTKDTVELRSLKRLPGLDAFEVPPKVNLITGNDDVLMRAACAVVAGCDQALGGMPGVGLATVAKLVAECPCSWLELLVRAHAAASRQRAARSAPLPPRLKTLASAVMLCSAR